MKSWIVSSLDEEIIQGEETIQGRKLYEEIRYVKQIKAGNIVLGVQVLCITTVWEMIVS